jgi:uncharacterized protein
MVAGASVGRPAARILACLSLLVAFFIASTAGAYTPPPISGHVTDVAGKLSQGQTSDLDQRLETVNRKSGAEIAVLITPSLNGETIEDVAYGAFNSWKLGKQGKDNGVLLVIAVAEHRVRIETGKGVEGQLTDLQTQDIIQHQIGPALKEDRFYDGVRAGTDAIAAALGASSPVGATGTTGAEDGANFKPVWVLLILGAIVFLLWLRSRRGGGGFWMGGGGMGGGGWGGGGGGDGGGFSGGGGSSGGRGSSGSY